MLKARSIQGSVFASRSALLGALSAACFSCGAPAQPVAVAPSVVKALPVSKDEAPELSPVAAPSELFALARFKKPQTAIETVGAWANFPFKLRELLPSNLKGLEGVVAWDAPVEAAMALDPVGDGKVPEPLAVLSIGLTSLDGALEFARAQGQSVRRVRAGVYRIGESDDVSCAAAASLGTTPARLICGHRPHDVDGLLDYATRGLPNESLPNLDFQLELRLQPIKKKYEAEIGSARLLAGFLIREVQLDYPRFDRALSDVTYSLVDEATALVHDIDRLRFETNLDSAKSAINVRFDMKFAGQKSWIVQSGAETLAMAEPAPPLFWQLPADSTSASFGVGWKAGRLKPIGHTLAELLDGYLEFEKAPTTLRNQASKAIELMFEQNTKQVRAQGVLAELPADPMLAADYRVFGWQLAAIEGDSKPLLALFDGLSATLSSKDLARLLKQRLNVDAALMPKLSSHAVSLRGFKPGAKAYRVELPREVFEKYAKLQLKLGDTAARKGIKLVKSVPLSLVIAYDGEHSWLGLSPDEKAILKRLESIKDSKTAVLRTRDGLDALRATPRTCGGFVTLGYFAGELGAWNTRGSDVAKLISALPHHGETPALFTCDVAASGPELTTSLALPRAAVEDLGALVPVIALLSGKHDSVLAE